MFRFRSSISVFIKSTSIAIFLIFALTPKVFGESNKDSSLHYWGEYESWQKWKVYVIPNQISKKEFIQLAEKASFENPNQRIRFFDDDKKISEYIAAEKFAWDTTGQVPRAKFPTEWRKKHLVGIISDRSEKSYNRWQIIYNKGGVSEHMKFLK